MTIVRISMGSYKPGEMVSSPRCFHKIKSWLPAGVILREDDTQGGYALCYNKTQSAPQTKMKNLLISLILGFVISPLDLANPTT